MAQFQLPQRVYADLIRSDLKKKMVFIGGHSPSGENNSGSFFS